MEEHDIFADSWKLLAVALSIHIVFFGVELIGGILSNSLALQTDAGHMLNDAGALGISLVAEWLARRPTNRRKTYGYYRAEVIAAFVNGIVLWAVVGYIFIEAFQRLQQPVEVQGLSVLLISTLGLVSNLFSAFVLSRSMDKNLNLKSAFLHVVADILGSIGAILSGGIILLTGWSQIDPIVSMIIGALIFYSSGKLVKASLDVLLESVPSHIDLDALERAILEQDGVNSVHDLHVWCVTQNRLCNMSAHVVIEKGEDRKKIIQILIDLLRKDFGIDHTTIQLEDEGYPKAESEH